MTLRWLCGSPGLGAISLAGLRGFPFGGATGHSSARLPNLEFSQRRDHARQMVPHTSGAEFEVRDSLLLLPVIDSPHRNIDRSGELRTLQ